MTAPKVAIIIYTVHDHVGKREHHNLTDSTYPNHHLDIVAEAIKQGVAQAGGAATIYQYVTHSYYTLLSNVELALYLEFLGPPRQPTPSFLQTGLQTSMHSCSAFPLALETFLLSGR